MPMMFKAKDGGPESKVTGYWLLESKRFFSIALLRFDKGSREAFHNHAFDAISWVLRGCLSETVQVSDGSYEQELFSPSVLPIITKRDRMHQVTGLTDTTWVLSFRGPWRNRWKEFLPNTGENITLTHGRKRV